MWCGQRSCTRSQMNVFGLHAHECRTHHMYKCLHNYMSCLGYFAGPGIEETRPSTCTCSKWEFCRDSEQTSSYRFSKHMQGYIYIYIYTYIFTYDVHMTGQNHRRRTLERNSHSTFFLIANRPRLFSLYNCGVLSCKLHLQWAVYMCNLRTWTHIASISRGS